MSNRKRLILEVVVAVLLILICTAIWNTAQQRRERQLARSEARQALLTGAGQDAASGG